MGWRGGLTSGKADEWKDRGTFDAHSPLYELDQPCHSCSFPFWENVPVRPLLSRENKARESSNER